MIFVVGCPRSGTTLLRDLLRSHSRLTFPSETRFIPTFYRAYGNPANDRAARRLARAILSFPWVRRWNPELTPDDFASYRSYRDVVERLFREWARHDGRPRWGDKTPGYVVEIPTLAEIFPSARFLHLVRDGRDVALSFMKAPFGPSNVYDAARRWQRMVAAGRRSGADLAPDSYLEMTYERLVTDPDSALRQICAFLEEPFDPRVLSPTRMAGDGSGHRPPPVSHTSIVADHVGRWKQSMSSPDVALFETVAGDLLRELGYEASREPVAVTRSSRIRWEAEDRWKRVLNLLRDRNYRRNHALLQWGKFRARLRSRGWIV